MPYSGVSVFIFSRMFVLSFWTFFISILKDAGYLLCLGLPMREWACVFMEARVEGQRLILSVLLNCFSNSFFFLSHTMYFSWTSDLPFSLYWLASEPPNSAFLYSPPHYWGYRCTQSHLAFMWMFVRSSWLCGKPLTHQAASLASEFPYIGCFQILSLCAKKTCLEGQDWLCTSLALVPCFPSIKFVQ